MQVILLERIEKLGQMGDVVNVKPGYARNYLLPQRKARRATKENIEGFQRERVQLEGSNLEQRRDAEAVAEKLEGFTCVLLRQASDSAQLYGSVTARDVAQAVTEGGTTIHRAQVRLDRPIKALGIHSVHVALHPEVIVDIDVNVARSADEAESQAAAAARGEATVTEAGADEAASAEDGADEAPPAEAGADEAAATEDNADETAATEDGEESKSAPAAED